MKTKIFRACFYKIILPALLLAEFAPTVNAQNLTVTFPSQARRVNCQIPASNDTAYGTWFGPFFAQWSETNGTFNVSDTETTPNGNYITAHCTASQNTFIASSPTSLTATGQMQILPGGTADPIHGGSASWIGDSYVEFQFTIDKPFTYSLQASTTMATNASESNPRAIVGFSDQNGVNGAYFPPFDIAGFGSGLYFGTFYTAASASGTNTGVIPAGTYYFFAQASSYSYVNFADPNVAENFTVSFNFTVNYVPPQPPTAVTFAPNGDGTFNLIWNAAQAGNYRVMSSSNLVDWAEAISSANYNFGPNTNVVNTVSGSSQGFFRVEYQP